MKIVRFLLIFISVAVISSCKGGLKQAKLKTDLDSVSYSIGVMMANDLKNNSPMQTVNTAAMEKAFSDIFAGKKPVIDDATAAELVQRYMMKAQADMLENNLKKSEEFLENNKKEKGVVELPSKLQYQVIQEGTGATPAPYDTVTVHYKGTLADGTVFDSSIERNEPAKFSLNPQGGLIAAWIEALQLMKVGSKWKLFVHPDLGYGSRPPRGSKIKANDLMIFEIELIDTRPGKAPQMNDINKMLNKKK
jgi:FKBP-type peptidyl-prolyl cis-trans isomerase FklB